MKKKDSVLEFSIHELQLIASALRDREYKWYEQGKTASDRDWKAYCQVSADEARELAKKVEANWS